MVTEQIIVGAGNAQTGTTPDAEVFNDLIWSMITWEDIKPLLPRCRIIGADPLDYPDQDGLILYLRTDDGTTLALNVGADLCSDPGENTFYMEVADIPRGVL